MVVGRWLLAIGNEILDPGNSMTGKGNDANIGFDGAIHQKRAEVGECQRRHRRQPDQNNRDVAQVDERPRCGRRS